MSNNTRLKLAYTKLENKFNKKFQKAVILHLIAGLLKCIAVIVTCFFFAYKIGTPSIGGGPATLLRLCSVAVGGTMFYYTMLPLADIREEMLEEYSKQKLMLAMKYLG